MQYFIVEYFAYVCFIKHTKMSIINVNKLVGMLDDRNHYTYVRVKNMLSGLKGKSTKKEIQQVRKLVQKELNQIDTVLAKLEEQ